MNKVLLLLMATTLVIGCGRDTVVLNDHGDRITSLEERMKLNEEFDAIRDDLIAANAMSISALQDDLIDLEQELKDLIDAERDARIAGDNVLADALCDAISVQSFINAFVQMQIASLSGQIGSLNGQISSLQSQIDDNASDIQMLQSQINDLSDDVSDLQSSLSSLEVVVNNQGSQIASIQNQIFLMGFSQTLINVLVQSQIGQINAEINMLSNRMDDAETDINSILIDMATMNSRIDGLESSIDDLEEALDDLGVQIDDQAIGVYKCNQSNSIEKLLKINGEYFGVMNRVKTDEIEVITGSSTETVIVPALCANNGGQLELPPCNGNTWNLISGSSTTIPAYSTKTVEVVTEVKMTLEALAPGNYMTTDGASPCYFSINSDGSANGLVEAQ